MDFVYYSTATCECAVTLVRVHSQMTLRFAYKHWSGSILRPEVYVYGIDKLIVDREGHFSSWLNCILGAWHSSVPKCIHIFKGHTAVKQQQQQQRWVLISGGTGGPLPKECPRPEWLSKIHIKMLLSVVKRKGEGSCLRWWEWCPQSPAGSTAPHVHHLHSHHLTHSLAFSLILTFSHSLFLFSSPFSVWIVCTEIIWKVKLAGIAHPASVILAKRYITL